MIYRSGTISGQRGISLIGVMVALFMLVVGIVAVTQLIARTQHSVGISRDRLVAAKLATEGLEIVRAQRDTNWLKVEDEEIGWTAGLCGEDGSNTDEQILLLVDVDDTDTEGNIGWFISDAGEADDGRLYEAVNGLWSHVEDGEETRFRRIITIDCSRQNLPEGGEASEVPELMTISSKVFWTTGVEPKQVEVKEVLYNWYRIELAVEDVTVEVPVDLPPGAKALKVSGFEAEVGEENDEISITFPPVTVGQAPILPWPEVESFSLTFDNCGNAQDGHLELRGVVTPIYQLESVECNEHGEIKWILAEGVDLDHDKLALMWVSDQATQLILRFDVLVGDVSQDGAVDEGVDLLQVFAEFGSTDAILEDVDRIEPVGTVSFLDLILVRNHFDHVLTDGEPNIE